MLQFVLGRAGSGKTRYLRELVADKSLSGRCVMLVPEQYSFETEKAMLALAGPQRANSIEIYSFTRLADTVFRREGGAAGRRLSDGGRRILMSSAIAACEEQLDVYAGAAKSGRITDVMLTAVNEMKMCGVSPQQLADTAEKLGDTGLGRKLYELSLLYGTYEALVGASYLDSRDDLTRLAEELKTSPFFSGATVAVDSFEGFTAQETAVLTRIMTTADNVVVSLCTDDRPQGAAGLFTLVERTRRRLTFAAEENNVPLGPPVVLTGAPRFNNEDLKLLETQLFCAEEPMVGENTDNIRLFRAKDVFEEGEFVAASIRRLVEEKGWRYRDFSIICRSPERYYASLGVALEKRGIPCFVSQPDRVDAQPVARFILGAFDAARSGLNTDDLLEMLKTGISGFTADEISDLENYAFLWRVNGKDWREEFLRHPRGFGQEFTPEDRAALEKLNALRRRLIEPLVRFVSNTRDATGAQICHSVYTLLTDYEIDTHLPAYCLALEEMGEDALAARQLRVWDLLMETLDQMRSILGDRKTPRDRYYALLKEVVANEDISEIPQTVDEVIFGTAEQVRQSSPKAAFLIGVSQGEFPLTPKSSGVFSDAERRRLIQELALPLGDPLEQKTLEERYLAYSVACAPSDLLVLSWPKIADGEDKEPSELVSAVQSVFPHIEIMKDLPHEFYADTMESAFSHMASCFGENTTEAATLRALFADSPQYSGRVEALARAFGGLPQEIKDPALARRLFGGREMFLSPTQIETFHSCAFKYFCRYGLNAKERRPAEVDVMQYGTLMHYLFEQVFASGTDTLSQKTDKALEIWVQELIYTYAQENMGGMELLSGREKYRLGRMASSACRLIRHVQEELSQSAFSPEYFELGLGKDRQLPPLKIETETGDTLLVGGTIDRVDMYVSPGGAKYVRVIDYKTGSKTFRLADVLHGLNMQMLIYLAALAEKGEGAPAGILYMPAAEPSVSAERDADEATIRSKADRQMRMSGLVLSDDEVIHAMESAAAGRFIPVTLNKDGSPRAGSSVLSGKDLNSVLAFSRRLIATMGEELAKGAVRAKPQLKNHNACRFCPYGAVCGQEYSEKDVEQDKTTAEEALRIMENTLGEGENTNG